MLKLNRFILSLVLGLLTIASVFAETITVTNTNPSGPGSLRQAILDANANPSQTSIVFNIPGSGPHVINVPEGALPDITAPVDIDGRTEPDQIIIFNGAINQPGADIAFTFQPGAAGSSLRGLTISNFVFGVNLVNTSGIVIESNQFIDNFGIDVNLTNASNIQIRSNFFSADPSRNVLAISGTGSNISIQRNSINGETIRLNSPVNSGIADNSVNGGRGIVIIDGNNVTIVNNVVSNTLSNRPAQLGAIEIIRGNGVTVRDNRLLGNADYDVHVINGGQHQINSNIITGAGIFSGILVENSSAIGVGSNRITGGSIEFNNTSLSTITSNLVVDDPQGFTAHGAITLRNNSNNNTVSDNVVTNNASHGILISESSGNLILRNQSSSNGRAGVFVFAGVSNRISRNIIFDNHADIFGGRTGIDLVGGGNFNKPAPVITSAVRSGNTVTLSGTTSTPGDVIEIFLSDQASTAPLVDNAFRFLGAATATGNNWTATIDVTGLSGQLFFIATATDTSNNTSEFSEPASVNPARLGIVSLAKPAYPNPFAETTNILIEGAEGQKASIRVFDTNGKLVFRSGVYESGETASLGSELTPGVYAVQVVFEDESTIQTTTLVKVK